MSDGNLHEGEEYDSRLFHEAPLTLGALATGRPESETLQSLLERPGDLEGPFLPGNTGEIAGETEGGVSEPGAIIAAETSPQIRAPEAQACACPRNRRGVFAMEEPLRELDEYDARLWDLPAARQNKPAQSLAAAVRASVSAPDADTRESPFLLGSGGEIALDTQGRDSARQSTRNEPAAGSLLDHPATPFLSSVETLTAEPFDATGYQDIAALEIPRQDEEFHSDRFPQNVRDAFAKTGSAAWRPMLDVAIAGGLTDPQVLTDLVFFMQHRERLAGLTGKLIDVREPEFVKLRAEWNLYATFVMQRLRPGFIPSVFLPANPSKDYFEYVNAPTSGRLTLMLNGLTSDKAWTEAFNDMQTTVELLRPGDSVYLAAFMFNPTKLTIPRPAMATWEALIGRKAQEGVKFRLLITEIPKAVGWHSDLAAIDRIISELFAAGRGDNLKYIFSKHPAQLDLSIFGRIDVGTHHQKFMVVKKDGATIAFCGGLDISPERTPPWPAGALIWHDTHARLEGRIARDLEKEFVLRWNTEKDKATRSSSTHGQPIDTLPLSAPDRKDEAADKNNIKKLQTIRTVSVGATPPDIRRDDVWRAYFKVIASAKKFIFIENQYLHEPFLARALVKQAENEPSLIVLLVISQVTDDPVDDPNPIKSLVIQHSLRQQFECFTILTAGIPKDRLRVYNMEGRLVHSKVIMVDDRAICMGSTNADPRDFFMDTQLNVVAEDTSAVTALRYKLWSHDLGVSEDLVKIWRMSDFFAEWDRVANRNASSKKAREELDGEGVKPFDIAKMPQGTTFPVPDIVTEVSETVWDGSQRSSEAPGSGVVHPGPLIENEIDGANLTWVGATPEQMDFMRAVFARHVANAKTRRPFIADIPGDQRSTVENKQSLLKQAAKDCVAMLSAVRRALAAAQSSGDSLAARIRRIRVVSGYRSAWQQFDAWQRNFSKYYAQTAAHRASSAGGPHGIEAVSYQAAFIANRLAAPGFSNHNSGKAVDLGADLANGRRLTADSSTASTTLWRSSWLFRWLAQNAARYGFFQNTSINEPWHWEYRKASTSTSPQAHADSSEPANSGLFQRGPVDSARPGNLGLAVPAGSKYISHTPLLAKHRGTQPDLYVSWNTMSSVPSVVDVVVHLHGHSQDRGEMLLKSEVALSGLDFSDPAGSGRGRTRPSVGIVPRGDYEPRPAAKNRRANPDVYGFPALVGPSAMNDLIAYGLRQLVSAVGGGAIGHDRLVLTCHSGGGDWLGAVLQNFDPDEIHLFDAIYGVPQPLLAWIGRHLAADDLGTPGTSAFRMFFTDSNITTPYAQKIAEAVHAAVDKTKHAAALVPYFRVEMTAISHLAIPHAYGWQLLTDASASVKQTKQI